MYITFICNMILYICGDFNLLHINTEMNYVFAIKNDNFYFLG